MVASRVQYGLGTSNHKSAKSVFFLPSSYLFNNIVFNDIFLDDGCSYLSSSQYITKSN